MRLKAHWGLTDWWRVMADLTKKVDRALAQSERALQRIESHEEFCTERHTGFLKAVSNLHGKIDLHEKNRREAASTIFTKIDNMASDIHNWRTRLYRAVIVLLVAALGFMIANGLPWKRASAAEPDTVNQYECFLKDTVRISLWAGEQGSIGTGAIFNGWRAAFFVNPDAGTWTMIGMPPNHPGYWCVIMAGDGWANTPDVEL